MPAVPIAGPVLTFSWTAVQAGTAILELLAPAALVASATPPTAKLTAVIELTMREFTGPTFLGFATFAERPASLSSDSKHPPLRPSDNCRSYERGLTWCEVLIDVQPSKVSALLKVPELQRPWCGTEVTLDPRTSGNYKIEVDGIHPVRGEFNEVVPDDRVAFIFVWDESDHPIPAGSTTVATTLTPATSISASGSCRADWPRKPRATTRANGTITSS